MKRVFILLAFSGLSLLSAVGRDTCCVSFHPMPGQCDELRISTEELMKHRLTCVAPNVIPDRNYKGVVAVEVIVDADGDVTCAKILRFAPDGIRQAVEATVKKWKFKPFKIDGSSKRVTGILAVAITDNPDITCGNSERK